MTIDRRTVLLGVAAAGAVVAAVTVTITNHKNGESRQRRDVSVYVKRVNALQNRMHAPLTRVMLAYRDFTAKGGPKKGAAAELQTAAVTLDRLNHRLAQLRAPKEATQLRRLLLALVAQQAALTREVELMARFVPPFQRALARSRAASTELGRALAAAPVPKGRKLRGTRKQVRAAQHAYQVQAAAAAGVQADAVDVYDRRIGGVLATLRTLHPPQALAVGYRAQVKALNDVVAAGGALATGATFLSSAGGSQSHHVRRRPLRHSARRLRPSARTTNVRRPSAKRPATCRASLRGSSERSRDSGVGDRRTTATPCF